MLISRGQTGHKAGISTEFERSRSFAQTLRQSEHRWSTVQYSTLQCEYRWSTVYSPIQYSTVQYSVNTGGGRPSTTTPRSTGARPAPPSWAPCAACTSQLRTSHCRRGRGATGPSGRALSVLPSESTVHCTVHYLEGSCGHHSEKAVKVFPIQIH